MTRRFARHRIALALCAAACWVTATACDKKSPLAPDTGQSGPGLAVLNDLRIEGNLHLAGPNDTSQLRALAVMSDGTVIDVTRLAVWQTTGAAVVSETGMMKGLSFGVDVLSVRYGTIKMTVPVRVMPDWTYVLAGHVREAGNLPVAGVLVEVTEGPTAGKRAQTDPLGRFNLTPVDGGPITLRFTANGYVRTSRQMVIDDDVADVELEMTPVLTPVSLAGEYQLTVEAASTCELPEEVRRRQYTATIAQDGARLTVKLSGATFFPCYTGGPLADHFDGRILDGNKVSFQVGWDDEECRHDVRERMTATSYVQFTGTVTGVVTERTISGGWDGSFGLFGTARDGYAYDVIAVCSPARHSLRFTR